MDLTSREISASEGSQPEQTGLQQGKQSMSDALGIEKGITAVIGSGGKTTLITKLAAELKKKGTVIATTTTHIYPFEGMPLVTGSLDDIREELKRSGIVCACSFAADAPKKYSAPECGIAALAGVADYVLVEADGSRMLPIKAHNDHEPVIPENTDQLIIVAGMNGIGRPISETVHRPELFCERANALPTMAVTPKHVAAVLARELPLFRTCGKTTLFLNRVETNEHYQAAEEISATLKLPCYVGSAAQSTIKEITVL